MTSREIVNRCIHFGKPPRPALWRSAYGESDLTIVYDFFQKDENGIDPWGIQWAKADEPVGTVGIPKTPPLKDISEIENIKPPDPQMHADRVRENLSQLTRQAQDKYRVIAASSGIWERAQYFRGMDDLMMDMLAEPEAVGRLLDICTDFWVKFLDSLSGVRDEIDCLYMFDDWGTQTNAMISPELWRTMFAPRYRRIVDAAHRQGMDFWLHSCGKITRLLPDFIDVGIDLVNPYQSQLCGMEDVAKFAGQIAFMSTVGSQGICNGKPAEEIRAECAKLARWGTTDGGLILSPTVFNVSLETERIIYDYFFGNPLESRKVMSNGSGKGV